MDEKGSELEFWNDWYFGVLLLALHIHMLAFDGVYAADENDRPQFQILLAPDDDEIARLTASLAKRITGLLDRRGLGPDSDPVESDSLRSDEPWLAGLYAAAVSGRTAYGPNAGRRVTRVGDPIDPDGLDVTHSPRCASVAGFSLHANVAVHAADRQRLERLARYCARPPIAMERLERLADGRLLYRFKRPWRDGTTHIVMEPLEMLEKLAALVPAPKVHLVRYSGLLAPAAKWRARIVPESGIESPALRDTVGATQASSSVADPARVSVETRVSDYSGLGNFAASTEGVSISGTVAVVLPRSGCFQMCSSRLCTDLIGQFKGVLTSGQGKPTKPSRP